MKPSPHTAYCLRMLTRVARLKGDAAECGVADGKTTFALDATVLKAGKKLYAFDTFSGFPYDDSRGGLKKGEFNFGSQFFDALGKRGKTSIVPVTGKIEDTLGLYAHMKFCFVWLDMDLYQPTAFACKFFEDRIVPGGILGFHDYRFSKCPGIAAVVDEELNRFKFEEVFNRRNSIFFRRREE